MILQHVMSGCSQCQARRLIQHAIQAGQLYRLSQARQLMLVAEGSLYRATTQAMRLQYTAGLLYRLTAVRPACTRFLSTDKLHGRQLLNNLEGRFYKPGRRRLTDSKKEKKSREGFVESYKSHREKKLLPDGIKPHHAIVICAVIYIIYHFFFTEISESVKQNNWKVTLYRKMPLKSTSRLWGKMMCYELPVMLREPLLGLYVWIFGVQLHEAEDGNLKNYKNLNELFRRTLKPDARSVDPIAPVISPADGRILHFGKVEDGIVEQVKGVNYTMQGFLGPQIGDEEKGKNVNDCDYQEKMNIKPGNNLYNCIIYLAPGDYHRFHSPSDWKISHRRHFPGELLSVNPGVARWVQGLFNMNERAVYSGLWEHGYFSFTAVGATNVGSIKIYFDENLETNIGPSHPGHVFHDRSFGSPGSPENIEVSKGEMVGEFNLGSTIVLLFEAPSNFEFRVKPGQKIKFGETLGNFGD